MKRLDLYMNKKKLIIGLAVAALVVGGVYFWRMGVEDDADPFRDYKMAMMRDEVGGATPAETLAMFITALRANDAEAAAELFMLDDTGSRATWQTQLADLQAQGMFAQMADDIEKNAKATSSGSDDYVRYELLNSDGSVGAQIGVQLNIFSGVWKLQSL